MTQSGVVTTDLVTRARAGDSDAFRELTEPHRRELQMHCYRMLGSFQDAEDALQDTLLAAWQGLEAFEGRASIRTWLYRIATNRCLNALRSANRRPAREWDIPEVEPPEPTRLGEVVWLEPYPDALLNLPLGPEARYAQTEAISLAFVTALQVLPARQRAVLILREVLGYHANEVADMLDSTVESVNSALKLARASLQRRLPPTGEREPPPAPDSPTEQALVANFVRAYESGDVDALVALLTADVCVSIGGDRSTGVKSEVSVQMRPQDWAFFGATALALFTVTATVQGWVVGALAGLALTAILGWTSHALSRRYPGPMPHIFRWGLLWPRGFLSPRRLRAILEPRSGERMLELGPGIGVHALPVATWLAPSGTLDVLDVQQPMLDHLARRAARAGVVNIVPTTGDGQRLPYPSASFDGAYLIDTLGEMSDAAAVLQELRRTLKPGGRLVVGEHFLDPDFVSLRLLKTRAQAAGFTFERRSGTALMYLARFRTLSSRQSGMEGTTMVGARLATSWQRACARLFQLCDPWT